ncbi:MAG: Bug family tripartite tricarboxylate transporter substrate binding protein [Burkholderiales bacterium]
MTPIRRRLAAGLLALPAVAAWTSGAHAQEYPNKPVRIIVPFPAGTGPDTNARQIVAKMQPVLGQSIVVENRPGAAGQIGTDAAAKAAPDGYTLYMGFTSTISIQPYVFSKLPYNAERDFEPVSLVGTLRSGLLAHPSVKAADMRELVAAAKANPDAFNAATQGIGTYSHLAGEWFSAATGAKLRFVPYNTSSPYADLLAGTMQLMFDGMPAAIGNIKGGKLKVLAVTGTGRHPSLPDVPTFAELGLPDYQPIAWIGLFAPAGTPAAIQEKLAAAVAAGAKAPDFVEQWRSFGGDPVGSTPAEFKAFIKADQARWSAVVRQAGVKLD